MTFDSSQPRAQDGKFGEKTGSAPETALEDTSAHQRALRAEGFRAAYFGEGERLAEIVGDLNGYGEEVDASRFEAGAARSHAILDFDRDWNVKHGLGRQQDGRDFDRAVYSQFGLSGVRFHQVLVANPEFRAQIEALEAEGFDTRQSASMARERLYPGARKNPVSRPTARESQEHFDSWEEKQERGR